LDNKVNVIQKVAVKQEGWVIRYIKNPSEEMKLQAVKNGCAISYIKNPSEAVQLEAKKSYDKSH
jgi:hypothetical protein